MAALELWLKRGKIWQDLPGTVICQGVGRRMAPPVKTSGRQLPGQLLGEKSKTGKTGSEIHVGLWKSNGLGLTEEADRTLESLMGTHFRWAETSTANDFSVRLSWTTLLTSAMSLQYFQAPFPASFLSLELTALPQYTSHWLAWFPVSLLKKHYACTKLSRLYAPGRLTCRFGA